VIEFILKVCQIPSIPGYLRLKCSTDTACVRTASFPSEQLNRRLIISPYVIWTLFGLLIKYSNIGVKVKLYQFSSLHYFAYQDVRTEIISSWASKSMVPVSGHLLF
jgi:hypothetical protein